MVDATPVEGPSGPDTGLEIEVVGDPADGCIVVAGELDAASADGLLDVGRRSVAAGARALVLDVSALRFCDSSGLRTVVLLGREVAGQITLRGPSEMLVRLLEVTGLDGV